MWRNDNIGWNDLQMSFKIIARGTNRKLVCELLLVVYSNFRRITYRFRGANDIFASNMTVMLLECGVEIWRQKN